MTDENVAWVKSIDGVTLKESPLLKGQWARMLDMSAPDRRGMIFIVGRIEPGLATGWHEHPEDEIFFVFKGRGVVRWRIGDEQHESPVEPGAAFFKQGGIPHEMEAFGDEPLIGVGIKV